MWLVICNNTKEDFLWEPNKKNFKFHKMDQNEILRIKFLPAFSQFLWNLKFIFSGLHKKLS